MQIKKPEYYGFSPDKVKMDSEGRIDMTEELPFELKAEDFINFAKSDMKGKSKKDPVNALSNIKRAIENRMDGLLFIFKYQIAKNWNFPDKVKKLNRLGIISPRILKRINKIRNLLEHQYRIPNKKQVEDAYDVAVLFLAYTKIFIRKYVTDFDCYLTKKQTKKFLRFRFVENGIEVEMGGKEYHVKAMNPNYDEYIKFLIEFRY